MQRLTCLAACRGWSGITHLCCPGMRRKTPSAKLQTQRRSWTHQSTRLYSSCAAAPQPLRLRRRSAGYTEHRQYCTDRDRDTDSNEDTDHPDISVVGTPDPLTWIRNKIILFLIELYFGLKFNVEFDDGVKQAVVHVSTMLSKGNFDELRDVMSHEAVESVRKKYKTLSEAQKRHLAISLDDIIFLLPEDISVFFDQRGRKFCYIMMRFWHLSCADVPEDPESTRIFKMDVSEGDGPQKKIITAVYEFHRELTAGADPDWTVTRLWHWKQLE